MTDRILYVDDDPNILQAYHRALRGHFHIESAIGGKAALAAVNNHGPYAVLVADLRMPEMGGVELLAKIRQCAPDTVRMMLTGNADLPTALAAVNEGHIFRFMTKPCPPEVLREALEAGIAQYRFVTAERELLSKTLSGSIKVLTDVLALTNPSAFGRSTRVCSLVKRLCKELKVERAWIIEMAAMLSQIGYVAVPEETLLKAYRGEPLSAAESKALGGHAEIARTLLASIPRLEEVAEIIVQQAALYRNTSSGTVVSCWKNAPLGSRILKLAIDWDTLVSGGLSHELATAEINAREKLYDPDVLAALRHVLKIAVVQVIRQVEVHELFDGAILADDVISLPGTLLCVKGQEVTTSMRALLRTYARNVGVRRPIRVLVPSGTVRPDQVRQAVPLPGRPEHWHTDRATKTADSMLSTRCGHE